jgi:anti-sigma factor RsiW
MNVVHPRELLAAYALDALPDDERESVQAHLAGCAECRREVARHRAVTEVLAMSVLPEQPPTADLRERILRESARTSQVRLVPQRQPARRRAGLSARLVGWLAAAVLLITSTGLGVWNLALREQLQAVSVRPAPRLALAATADAPGASGGLAIDSSGAALVTVSNLQPLAAGRVYEAWVIDANGPKPAGTFLTTSDGRGALALTQVLAPGQIVAVTAEPSPGTEAPTGKVLLKGTVGGA